MNFEIIVKKLIETKKTISTNRYFFHVYKYLTENKRKALKTIELSYKNMIY